MFTRQQLHEMSVKVPLFTSLQEVMGQLIRFYSTYGNKQFYQKKSIIMVNQHLWEKVNLLSEMGWMKKQHCQKDKKKQLSLKITYIFLLAVNL